MTDTQQAAIAWVNHRLLRIVPVSTHPRYGEYIKVALRCFDNWILLHRPLLNAAEGKQQTIHVKTFAAPA
jgi:hypothetical protein